jgi:transposase
VECGDLVKLLWWDGDGLCLFAKRLERERFVWPRAEEGVVLLSGRNSRCYSKGSIGGCRGEPGGQSWPADIDLAKAAAN